MHCTLIPHWRWSLLLIAPFSSISLLAHLRLRVEADLPLHVDSFENCTLIENFIHMDYLYLDFFFSIPFRFQTTFCAVDHYIEFVHIFRLQNYTWRFISTV